MKLGVLMIGCMRGEGEVVSSKLGWVKEKEGKGRGAHIIHRASGSDGGSFGTQVASLWSSCSPYWWWVKVNESISTLVVLKCFF